MAKYITELINYWQYKIIAGVLATIFTDDFFKLVLIFSMLEILDIATRMVAESKACWHALYPETKGSIMTYLHFLWQARKWRYIRSDGLRSGSDKLLTYLLLILAATTVDSALKIAGADKILLCTGIVCGFLAVTELLSIIENVSEFAEYGIIKKIAEKIKCNLQKTSSH